ncbi:hypothetical protein [Nocardia brasiliensis]|uniref:hypothetical protein n=1 Tax=Nocardia brasiliensis TaxID=37326 RepID=UPI002453D4C9|nr:hypothetical protein [Nocardia brasiliensis]
MSGDSPSGLAEQFKKACGSILLGVLAIYFAVALTQSIWPTLAIILGVLGVLALIIGGIIIFRKMRAGW